MRIDFDRQVTMGLISPLRRCLRRRRDVGRIPVLMYHSISDDPEHERASYFRLCTPRWLFRRHLQLLQEQGFRSVDLHTAVAAVRRESAKPNERLVVITFDDGFQNVFDAAWPELSTFGFTASVFLPSDYVCESRRTFLGRPCLVWEEVRELHRCGISFGSHTMSHPRLWEAPPEQRLRELAESKRVIEDKIQEPVRLFSHPFAFPSADPSYVLGYKSALQFLGYDLAVATTVGRLDSASDPHLIPRMPANSADDDRLFLAKLQGDYDWVAGPQRAFKALKALRSRLLRRARPSGWDIESRS